MFEAESAMIFGGLWKTLLDLSAIKLERSSIGDWEFKVRQLVVVAVV